MGHPKKLLQEIADKLRSDYFEEDYEYAYEISLKKKMAKAPKGVMPDIIVTRIQDLSPQQKKGVVCVVEIGYTRPEKLEEYRRVGIPDIRWYSKKGALILHEDGRYASTKIPGLYKVNDAKAIIRYMGAQLDRDPFIQVLVRIKALEVCWRYVGDVGDRSIHNIVLREYSKDPLIYRYALNVLELKEYQPTIHKWISEYAEHTGNYQRSSYGAYKGIEYSVLPVEALVTASWMLDVHKFLKGKWDSCGKDAEVFPYTLTQDDLPECPVLNQWNQQDHYGYIWSAAAQKKYSG